ncbi:DMT family transporter [Paenibacillus agricola]|uniref:Multidrug efflux SMR transporter n=1 Tax=Paenibacillus agricola TaxID=2716264 RepID=A0ABX0J2E4_9BACL|nr:multidrug efflux SMR transporter [Paenibacillus agricola]NHN29052.1 multidrug efflux SMR transporter [Paenibacillus agricola]
MAYLFLAISIVSELIGTSMLKASQGFTKLLPILGVIISFGCSFFFLSLSLKTIPLNAAYAIWSGLGTIATVAISVLIWKEKINIGSIIGISLIVIGVAVLNLFGPAHGSDAADPSKSEPSIAQKK